MAGCCAKCDRAALARRSSLGDPPEGCGSRYAALVSTPGGRTELYPCTGKGWCSSVDVSAWSARNDSIAAQVRGAWNRLMRAANAAQNWSETDRLDADVKRYEATYSALPMARPWQVFGAFDAAGVVASHVEAAKLGVCVLELLQDALERAKVAPVAVPAGSPGEGTWWPDVGDIGGPLALVGLALLAAYVASDRRRAA